MTSTSILPLEIQETIIDILAEDDHTHLALKACSLVCRAFLPRCRAHIFDSIVLNGLGRSPNTPALERLLSERPEIANYIRKLDYTVRTADLTDPSIQISLKRIRRLESLTLRHRRVRFDWSDNPMRSTLLHLLHLPTLTHFMLFEVNNFVVSDLIPCVNLKHLAIGFHTTGAIETKFPATLPKHPIQLDEFITEIGIVTAMKLCTARRPDGHPIIDFKSLSKIKVMLDKPDDVKAAQELFRHYEKLASVDLWFCDPRQVRPNLADMLRPSMQTLKNIAVKLAYDSSDDSLFGIPSELEDMRTKNVIESITITVLSRSTGDDWSRLDEVLTSLGWFALKRVLLVVITHSTSSREQEVALRQLVDTKFPRLLASKSVSFNFVVKSWFSFFE